MLTPKVVTFAITSRCNNRCAYCYGRKDVKELPFRSLKRIFSRLRKLGTEAVVLTGGEPTMRKDFPKIVRELKRQRLRIFLDTNGDFFSKHRRLIADHVSVIGFPIDLPDASYRNDRNLDAIIAALAYLKSRKRRPTIRIGTVVTKDNGGRLNEIGELLKAYPVSIWKLYEFIPMKSSWSLENKSRLQIPRARFEQATKRIEKKFSKQFKVVVSRRVDRDRCYFFIDCDGRVFMPVDDLTVSENIIYGSIFDKDIVKRWNRFISDKNYVRNWRRTFDYP